MWNVELLALLPGKLLCAIWNLVTKTYPKFGTLRSLLKLFKNAKKCVATIVPKLRTTDTGKKYIYISSIPDHLDRVLTITLFNLVVS